MTPKIPIQLKKPQLLIELIVISLFLTNCTPSQKEGYPFRWPAINEKVDSLSQVFDCAFFNGERAIIQEAYDSLSTLNTSLASEELALRLKFFKARIAECDGDEEGYSNDIIRNLEESLDSSKQSYLYHRIAFNFPESTNWNTDEFERLKSSVEFFQKKGDDPMTAMALIHLGNLLKDIRDPKAALKVYSEADSLLKVTGFEKPALFNRMNIASSLIITGDTVKASEIMMDLEKNPKVRADTGMWKNVLHNLYIECGQRSALDTLFHLQQEETTSLVETFMSNALLNEGNIKEAVNHAAAAVQKALDEDNKNDYAVALYAESDALSAMGDSVGAYRSLLKAVELTDEISMEHEPEGIKDQETARIVSIKRLERELAQSRTHLRIAVVGLVLLGLIIISWLIVRLRITRLKEKSDNELKRNVHLSRKLTATQIAMDETSKVLDDVSKALQDMKTTEASSKDSQQLVSTVHTHKIRNEERESFIETFSALHPDFARRLKNKNDAITEPDIRVASYIATGMDNKHIAATLGIRPESVKQARWRLRTKLGLAKGESLEDTLREMNS